MNLQRHLLSRIAWVAVLCLLVIAACLLYQSHRQAEQSTEKLAADLAKQLDAQLLLLDAGIGRGNPFPDFELWKQSASQPGICLAYTAAGGAPSHSLCTGTPPVESGWPAAFEYGYRHLFNPGRPVMRTVGLPGKVFGTLTVTAGAELEVAQAWGQSLSLMALSSATVLAVCLWVYWTIRRALQPAQIIVNNLKIMEAGDLSIRLPTFELNEWQRIASAINQLVASQQQLMAERQQWVTRLIEVQEQERRYLARELHDEYGQCLAAINAVASAIKQSAAPRCPELINEAEHISQITTHLLGQIRELLGQLRPAEFDELGLAASLNGLVAGWNRRCTGKIRYQLSIDGDCALLSEEQAVALFRIAQESLTNVAKHAQASRVVMRLLITTQSAVLKVEDNGLATQLPFTQDNGIGLLGIRERLAALRGQLRLAITESHGLTLEAQIPVNVMSTTQP